MNEDEAEALGFGLILEEEEAYMDLGARDKLLAECQDYLEYTVSVYVGDGWALDLLTKLKERGE